MRVSPIRILLVEDNAGDVLLMQEAFKENRLLNDMDVVRDGEKALAYLNRQPPYAKARRPDLILLDLNLPRINGHEVLSYIKQDPELRMIPVVVLTSSDDSHDIREAYARNANCYITKPVSIEKLISVARDVGTFWLSIVSLPPEAQAVRHG